MYKTEKHRQRVRIALVIDRIVGWSAGGTERQLGWLLHSLDRTLFEPVLFVLDGTPAIESLPPSVQVCVLNSQPRWFNLKLLYDLRKQLLRFGPHIVQGFFYDATVFAVIAARLAGVRVTVQSRRSMGYAQLGFLRRAVLRLANRLTTSWQCNSRFVAASVSKNEGIGEDKIAIVPNILDPHDFYIPKPEEREVARRELSVPITAPIFICVSNLRPVKDLVTLIRAAVLVHHRLPEAQFLIVGDGPMRELLQREIDDLHLHGIVRLIGPQLNIRTWLIAADIGILTSRSEGSSNALLEYMSTGLPTIVSDIPANRELVNQQLFRTGDAADLAANISGLWIDLDARTRIRDANQVRIDEHRPEKVISQLQRYYLDLAAKYCGGVSDCLSSSIALSASNQQ
jgi:L-malate glycosyltransferase